MAARTLHGSDDEKRWQEYAERATGATIYHDLAWRGIFGSALGYRSVYLMAEDGDGAIRGILPLFRVPSLLGKPRLVAIPFRDRGGIVADDADALAVLVAAAADLAEHEGCGSVEIKTLRPYPEDWKAESILARHDYWIHSEVGVAAAREDLQRNLGQKRRNMLRQAQRAGLSAHRLDLAGAIDIWYSIYGLSQKSLGLPAFPRRFFEEMGSRIAPARTGLFVTKDADGTALSAAIVFREPSRVIYAYSASRPGSRGARPNDLMLEAILNDCIDKGVQTFDMGADSPDQEGLLFFKRSWGASQRALPYYYLGNPDLGAADSTSSRFGLARRLVRRVPVPISARLLSPLVRFFG